MQKNELKWEEKKKKMNVNKKGIHKGYKNVY